MANTMNQNDPGGIPYLRVRPAGGSIGPYEVFVSYSHVDEARRLELETHLAPLCAGFCGRSGASLRSR